MKCWQCGNELTTADYPGSCCCRKCDESIKTMVVATRAACNKHEVSIPPLGVSQAEGLARKSGYAFAHCDNNGENPVNWADAGQFFNEGYEYARRLMRGDTP